MCYSIDGVNKLLKKLKKETKNQRVSISVIRETTLVCHKRNVLNAEVNVNVVDINWCIKVYWAYFYFTLL